MLFNSRRKTKQLAVIIASPSLSVPQEDRSTWRIGAEPRVKQMELPYAAGLIGLRKMELPTAGEREKSCNPSPKGLGQLGPIGEPIDSSELPKSS